MNWQDKVFKDHPLVGKKITRMQALRESKQHNEVVIKMLNVAAEALRHYADLEDGDVAQDALTEIKEMRPPIRTSSGEVISLKKKKPK